VVGSFPRGRLIFLGQYFNPLLGHPVEDIDRIESLFVGASTSKHYDPIIL